MDQSLTKIGGHYFEYSRATCRGALATGLQPVLLANRQLSGDAARSLSLETEILVRPWFSQSWDEGENTSSSDDVSGNFADKVFAALAADRAGPDDIVLIHTLGWSQFSHVIDAFIRLPRWNVAKLPSFRIVLRYEPRDMDSAQVRRLRAQLGLLRQRDHPPGMVKLFSDTNRLSEAYTGLFGVPFHTVPIPFDAGTMALPVSKPTPKILTIAYLGDARDEKGFHYIPDIIKHVMSRQFGNTRVHFVIQCNFNVPGGEPLAGPAKRSLERYPKALVTLVPEALSVADYRQQLERADIILLPYDAKRYRSRSSGILVEALATGKVIITSAGSWMAAQIDLRHGVVYSDAADLPVIVEQTIRTYVKRGRYGPTIAAEWRRKSNPKRLVEALLPVPGRDVRQPSQLNRRPHVVLVMDGDAVLLRNGASQVFRNQLGFLQAAGCPTTLIFIATRPGITNPETLVFQERLEQEFKDSPLLALYVAVYRPAAEEKYACSIYERELRSGRYSIARDLAFSACLEMSSHGYKHLAHHKPDVILLNYVTFLPFVEKFRTRATPVICEMHDIQSDQKAIYGNRHRCRLDQESELEQLRKCQFIVAVNEQEASWVAKELPNIAVKYVPIQTRPDPLRLAELLGPRSINALIAGCACSLLDPATSEHARKLSDRLERLSRIDLLFVSSNHLSNVDGLTWFLQSVFQPYLAPLGVTLIVAGTIWDVQQWPVIDGVAFVGAAGNLRPLYAATKLVVLPITKGAGSPVKTIEAMSFGKPIVATPLAFRGLEAVHDVLEPCATAETFGRRILRLLADPTLRREAACQSWEITNQLARDRSYHEALGAVFTDVLGGHVLSCPGEGERQPFQFVEWDRDVELLNRALLGLSGAEPMGTDVFREAARLVGSDAMQDRLASLFAAENGLEHHSTNPDRPSDEDVRLTKEARAGGNEPGMAVSSLLAGIGSLGVLRKLLSSALHSAVWSDAFGLSLDPGEVPVVLATGMKLSRHLLLPVGDELDVEVTVFKKRLSGLGNQISLCYGNRPLKHIHTEEGAGTVRLVFRIPKRKGGYLHAGALEIAAKHQTVIMRIVTIQRFAAEPNDSVADEPGHDSPLRVYRVRSLETWLRVRLTDPVEQTKFAGLPLLLQSNLADPAILYAERRGADVEWRLQEQTGPAIYGQVSLFLPPALSPPDRSSDDEEARRPTVEVVSLLLGAAEVPDRSTSASRPPKALPVEGYIDEVDGSGTIRGWVWCPRLPAMRLKVLALLNFQVIAESQAGIYRADVRVAGKGDGRYGFTLQLASVGDLRGLPIHVGVAEASTLLSANPVVF